MSKDDVERVARIIHDKTRRHGERTCWNATDRVLSDQIPLNEFGRDFYRNAARAALSAMHPPELRIGGFVLRPALNGIWIGRDGEGGEFATEHVERVIAQFYRENF